MDPWAQGRFRLFISHSSVRKSLAHGLRKALKAYAIDAFVAHDAVQPTEDWQGVIEYALRTADAMIAFLSPEFRKSAWCDQEVGAMVAQNKLIVSACLGMTPHGFLARFQGLRVAQLQPSEIAGKLFRILRNNEKTQPAIGAALVSLLEGSDTYEEAKDNSRLLEKLPRLDKDLRRRVRATLKDNRQVYEAFGVPVQLNAILAKWRKAEKA